MWSALPFLRCSYLKDWPWKSKVKVMGEVKVQSHNVSLTTSYRLTSHSFHVNLASHCWVTTFSKFDLEIQGSRSWVRSQLKSQWGSNILLTQIPFAPCQSGIPFLSYDFFQNLTLKIKGQGHGWGHSSKSQCGSSILSRCWWNFWPQPIRSTEFGLWRVRVMQPTTPSPWRRGRSWPQFNVQKNGSMQCH